MGLRINLHVLLECRVFSMNESVSCTGGQDLNLLLARTKKRVLLEWI
jgi:hypothetical protein